MIDLDNNTVEQLNDFYRLLWVGSGGSFISFEEDSLCSHKEAQIQIGAVENWTGDTMTRSISYSADASLLVENVSENSDYFLRACDESGNTVWES